MQEEINNQETISDQDVHVMPSLNGETAILPAPIAKNKNNLTIVISVIIALALALALAAVVYFLFFANKPTANQVDETAKTNQQENNNNQIANIATSTAINSQSTATSTNDLLTSAGRDQQRLDDISTLRLALEQYYKNQSQFPYELGALLDGYITVLPKEAFDGQQIRAYSYVVDANRLDYKIIFTIETNPVYLSVRLSPGKYYANRQTILPYVEPGNLGAVINGNNGSGTNTALPFNLIPPATGMDSDADGLTDIEENVWGSNPEKIDSDGDGYKDKDELMAFYDPAIAKKRLLDSKAAAVYKNTDLYYSVVYPAAFTVRTLPTDDQQVIFSDANGAFFSISVKDNPSYLSTYSWYQTNNPNVATTNFRSFLIDSFPALQTPDGLITFVAVGNKVYILSYNLGTINEANYLTTYRLFLKSFIIDETAASSTATSTPR
jgi:hypothetical protein